MTANKNRRNNRVGKASVSAKTSRQQLDKKENYSDGLCDMPLRTYFRN